jgi:hypothetical protein
MWRVVACTLCVASVADAAPHDWSRIAPPKDRECAKIEYSNFSGLTTTGRVWLDAAGRPTVVGESKGYTVWTYDARGLVTAYKYRGPKPDDGNDLTHRYGAHGEILETHEWIQSNGLDKVTTFTWSGTFHGDAPGIAPARMLRNIASGETRPELAGTGAYETPAFTGTVKVATVVTAPTAWTEEETWTLDHKKGTRVMVRMKLRMEWSRQSRGDQVIDVLTGPQFRRTSMWKAGVLVDELSQRINAPDDRITTTYTYDAQGRWTGTKRVIMTETENYRATYSCP